MFLSFLKIISVLKTKTFISNLIKIQEIFCFRSKIRKLFEILHIKEPILKAICGMLNSAPIKVSSLINYNRKDMDGKDQDGLARKEWRLLRTTTTMELMKHLSMKMTLTKSTSTWNTHSNTHQIMKM